MSVAEYKVGKPYHAIAQIPYHDSNNRMHSDGLPQQLGFRGPLVLGLATYGNMTRALVGELGERWLGQAIIEVKFLSVVCEGDRLRVETERMPGELDCYRVTAYNESNQDKVAACMETSIPGTMPPPDASSCLDPIEWTGPVTQRRTWDVVVVGRPYRSLKNELATLDNSHWCKVLGDDLPIYHGDRAPLHPTHVLRQVQLASTNQYRGDNAVHASTRAVVRKMLRIGDPIEMLAVPTAKWEKKGNHWVTLYCCIRSRGDVCAEIYHTQIFKLRGS